MSELITSSLIWRSCTAIAAWMRRSWFGRLFARLGQLWRTSLIYSLFARLLCSTPRSEFSAYRRWMDRMNLWLYGFRDLLHGSFFYGLCRRVGKSCRESFFLGRIFSRGLTGVLLVILASYAPIDYLLRDVLQLSLIASVWDELLMLFCFVWMLLRRVEGDGRTRSRAGSAGLFLAFYLLAHLVLFVFTADEVDINITGMRASAQYILLFFVVLSLIRDRKDLLLMYRVLVLIGFALALHGIWQFVVGVEIPTHWTDHAEQSVRTRVFSIFSNPNIMGAYMILSAPMAIALAYASENVAEKVFCWIAGLCMCGACLFTMSRGAWMALAAAAVLFSLIIDRKLFGLLLAAGLASFALPFVRSRIGYLFTDAFQLSNRTGGRALRWEKAFEYLDKEQAWTLGLGHGIYGGAVAVQNPIRNYEYMYVDNYYVKTLAENGIVGLSCLLTALGGLLYQGVKTIARTGRTPYKPLCAGILAAMVGILIQSFFESLWEEPYLMALFFIVAAMMICAGFLHREEKDRTIN